MTWDEYAATWDDDQAVRTYAEAAFHALTEASSRYGLALAGARVCDFGCGTGLLTERLAVHCAAIDAVDTSVAMLEVLKAKIVRRQWHHVRPVADLPDPGGAYDLVLCSSVCAFLDDYAGTVRALALRLRPGALFVQWDWEKNPDDKEPFGLSRDEIRRCLEGAGLEVLSVDTGFSVGFEGETMAPLMAVARKRSSAP